MAKEDSKGLAELVNERYGIAARSQRQVIDEMEQARLFFRGDQWLKYQHMKWRPAKNPNWRVRLTVNKLPPIVNLLISTFLRYKPIIIATPSTDEDQDRKTAKIAEMLLRHFWQALEFHPMLKDLLTWVLVCGSGFVRTTWDPTKGKKIPQYLQIPGMDETGSITMQDTDQVISEEPEGFPCVDVISPFSMSVEPGALKFKDAGWCICTEILRRGALEKRFNKKIVESTTLDPSLHVPMLLDGDGPLESKDRVALFQMYERPTKKHENGQLVYCVGDQVLHKEDLPGGEVRIEHFKGIELPGEFWPTSICSQVIPMQMEINKGRSQLIENRNLCARPQLLSALGAVEQDAYNNKPGNVLSWDPTMAKGYEPKYMTPPQVPGWVMQILGLANEDMMDLASRHEASQGRQGSNITSGKQAAMFRTADDSRLAPDIRSFETSLKSVGRHLLATAAENMKGPQVLNIIGRNRQAEFYKFNAEDIDDKCNVTFEIASQLPWARESMRQQVMYLNQQGKMDDETMYEMLELPTIQRLYEHEQEHRLNARYENARLEEGYFPPLSTDNHTIHLQEHERDINLPENRERLIAEMLAQAQTQQLQAQQAPMMGQEAPQEQEEPIPPSLQNKLKHMDAHRNKIPAQQPPAPAAKINLNLDRLLQNPAVLQNPQAYQTILQLVQDLTADAAGEPATPSNPPPPAASGTRAPGGAPPTGSPPGGMSGEMYGSGAESAAGVEGIGIPGTGE
jgi:hypothetical protein